MSHPRTMLLLSFFLLSKCAVAEQVKKVPADEHLTFSIKVERESEFFKNAYSYLRLSIKGVESTPPPKYIKLPDSIAHNSRVQSVFDCTENCSGETRVFDVFFPLFSGLSAFPIEIFPEGTDINNLSSDSFPYVVKVNNVKEGSALMLYQEDKEKNVRVFQIQGKESKDMSVSYLWYGSKDVNSPQRIDNTIVHLTEEEGSQGLIHSAGFKNNGRPLREYVDPSTNKTHLYFFTDNQGLAKLDVSPKSTEAAGKLIYWPFADMTSEAARLVIYNPSRISPGLVEPIPIRNPVVTEGNCEIKFKIRNEGTDLKIEDNGWIYVMVNDSYDVSFPSVNKNVLNFSVSSQFVKTSKTQYPAANNIRYIYVDRHGNVNVSSKSAFFAFNGSCNKK